MKSVPSILFYKKTAKIDRFEKGTHNEKTANIDKFEKGTPYTFYQKTAKILNWGLTKLSKKQGGVIWNE